MLEVKQLKTRRQDLSFCYDLHCHPGQIVALLGASGCGKSTLLAMIGGFIPATGILEWQGESLLDKPVAQRPLSSLFQHYNLFAHLTIWQNLALGMKGSLKLSADEQQRLIQVAKRLSIQDYLQQRPESLSGGQSQRAALARALLRGRPVLLLDEPFSALDPILRDECLQLVKELCYEHQLAILLVTHQFSDARAIADEVAFIEHGRVIQQCSPQALQSHPASDAVSRYLSVS